MKLPTLTTLTTHLGFALAAVFGALGVYQAYRAHRLARAVQVAALRGDSLEAALDQTRVIAANDHDAYVRRIVQATVHANALEDSLGLERRARYVATVQVDTLRAFIMRAVVAADSADSVRRAHFEQVAPPYHLSADVALPRTGTGTLSASVALDPLRLAATVGCGKGVGGIRPATLIFEAPRWATVTLDSLHQDPAVCNAPAGLPAPKGRGSLLGKLGLAAVTLDILLRIF